MVNLKEETFQPPPGTPPVLAEEILFLSKRLKDILTELCGPPTEGTSDFPRPPKPPKALNAKRDWLKPNYEWIWQGTTIIYEKENYGASARSVTNTIVFGEFFLKTEIEILTLTKVLLHEFLHLVVDMPKEFHHGQINKIIKENLRYLGDPNPLGTD